MSSNLKRQSTGAMRYSGPKEELKWHQKLWMTLDDPSFSKASFWYAQFSLLIIIVSTLSFCLETELNCELAADHAWLLSEKSCQSWEDAWKGLEQVAVYIFSAEFVLRFATCPSKLMFMRGAANWIDLVAIVPFYVSLAANGDALAAFSVFRVIRLVRVFRVFKMGKSSIGISLMTATMAESMKVLFILCYFVAIAMVLFSSMMYYAEMEGDQGKDFFVSIPRTFWWCLVTMTTVGYGDGYPVTTGGRVIAVMTMFCGILILALPISVIGSNFARQYDRLQFEMDAQKAVRGEGKDSRDRVDAKRLREFLVGLEIQGSLKVPLPKDAAEMQEIINEFDPSKQSKLEPKQWQALIQRLVVDPSEFTDTTVLKLARDLYHVRHQVIDLAQLVKANQAKSDAQMAELKAMLASMGAKSGASGAAAADTMSC